MRRRITVQGFERPGKRQSIRWVRLVIGREEVHMHWTDATRLGSALYDAAELLDTAGGLRRRRMTVGGAR